MVVEACIILFCQGCAVAYIIAIADVLQQAQLLFWNSRPLSMVVIWTIFLLPLSLSRTMTALQMSSAVGIASIGTLVFAALIHLLEEDDDDDGHSHGHHNTNNSTNVTNITEVFYSEHDKTNQGTLMETMIRRFTNDSDAHFFNTTTARSKVFTHSSTILSDDLTSQKEVDWFELLWPQKGTFSILTACPIILFAFSCQVNVCAIYEELPQLSTTTTNTASSRQRPPPSSPTANIIGEKEVLMRRVTAWAVAVCCTLYASISIITLADFGTAVTPNILNAYKSPLRGIMQVAAAGVVLAVTMAFPLNLFPARVTLDGCLGDCSSCGNQQQQDRFRSCCSRPFDDVEVDEELTTRRCSCCSCLCFCLRPDRTETQSNTTLTAALLEDQDVPVDVNSPLLGGTSNNQGGHATTAAQIPDEDTPGVHEENGENAVVDQITTTEEQEKGQQEAVIREPQQVEEGADEESTLPFPWFRHIMITLALAGSALGIALVAPNISIVFQVIGGTASSALGFCVPGLLGLRLGRDLDNGTSWAITCTSWLLLYGGVLIALLTTALTIYQIVTGTV